jgi:uncharacterized protein
VSDLQLNTEEKTHHGKLARGCKLCVQGRKSVLFITGKCHYTCFYCPISDDKRNTNIFKINERVVVEPDTVEGAEEVLDEILACQSTGVGITGGDPLAETERTVRYIKLLKKTFGKEFHIHLYTSLPYLNEKNLEALENAGLDELRLHVDVANKDSWKKLEKAKNWTRSLGIELPAIPGEEQRLRELFEYCKELDCIEFVNLNELEYSDISESVLTKKGFFVKNELSYGIQESEELAKQLVLYGKEIDLSVHYCSCSFKDRVQLGNRLLLRAQQTALPLDVVDEQGMITRGIVCVKEEAVDLDEIATAFREEFDVPEELLRVETERLLVAPWVLQEIWSEITDEKFPWKQHVQAMVVTQYPTADEFVVEQELL